MLRILRLWLLPLLVALLPLHSWAGDDARVPDAVDATPAVLLTQDDCADPRDSDRPLPLAEAGETAPSGADLAEHLLPASAPRIASARPRAGLPGYAGPVLPDPDLPLLPRPPRG